MPLPQICKTWSAFGNPDLLYHSQGPTWIWKTMLSLYRQQWHTRPNFKCLWQPPCLVRSSFPSGKKFSSVGLFIYPWEEGITKDNLLAIRYPSSPLPPSSGHLSQTLSAERVPPRSECEEYIQLFEYIGHECSFGHSIISIFSFMKIFRHSSVLSLFDRIYSNIRS